MDAPENTRNDDGSDVQWSERVACLPPVLHHIRGKKTLGQPPVWYPNVERECDRWTGPFSCQFLACGVWVTIQHCLCFRTLYWEMKSVNGGFNCWRKWWLGCDTFLYGRNCFPPTSRIEVKRDEFNNCTGLFDLYSQNWFEISNSMNVEFQIIYWIRNELPKCHYIWIIRIKVKRDEFDNLTIFIWKLISSKQLDECWISITNGLNSCFELEFLIRCFWKFFAFWMIYYWCKSD